MNPASVYDASFSLTLGAGEEGLEVIATAREGSGPSRFLLLHGNPGSMLDFAPLVDPLAVLGPVAAYDSPGFGRSPSPPRPELLHIETTAELVPHMLDHLGWPDAVLVGHSHGGGVAQRVAARRPKRVRGLVLLGTLALPAHLNYRVLPLRVAPAVLTFLDRLFPRLDPNMQRRLVRAVLNFAHAPRQATEDSVRAETELIQGNPRMLRNMALVTRGEPCRILAEGATQITAPTLFIHGTEDRVVPIHHARRLHAAIVEGSARSELVEVSGAGHMLPVDDVDTVVSEIRAWLTSLARAS